MGHNSVVSGHSKSTGIPQVDRLSTEPPNLGCHTISLERLDNRLVGFYQIMKGLN